MFWMGGGGGEGGVREEGCVRPALLVARAHTPTHHTHTTARKTDAPARPMYPGFMVMNALVPSSSAISTPSAATKRQPDTAACAAPAASVNSSPLRVCFFERVFLGRRLSERKRGTSNAHAPAAAAHTQHNTTHTTHTQHSAPAGQRGLAALRVGHRLVLHAAHRQHLGHQAVELVKAAPRARGGEALVCCCFLFF